MTDDQKLSVKGIPARLDDALEITLEQKPGLDMSPTDAAALVANFLDKLANQAPPHPMDMDFRAIALVLRQGVRDE